MRKIFNKNRLIKLLLILGVIALLPIIVNADAEQPNTTISLLGGISSEFVNGFLAYLSEKLLTLFSYILSVSGYLLSISINLTVRLGDLYNSIPALDSVWRLIRNFASILVIFMLLYASIQTILGIGGGGLKKLVGSIIIAGVLINFSLFFTRILIDASNLVSLQFYKAIAPTAITNLSENSLFKLTDGGLSDTFLSVLKVQRVYGVNGVISGENIKSNIFVATAMGSIVMITATFSLAAAAIAFAARTGILIFIMALSPLFAISWGFPQYKGKISPLWDMFKSQLIFMPVYLFLMYVALSFIADPNFTKIFENGINGSSVTGSVANSWAGNLMAILVQYVIALIFINIPLVAAIKMGAIGAKWAPDAKYISGWMAKKTVAKYAGTKFDKYLENTRLGNSAGGRAIRSVTTGALASAKLGTSTSRKDDEKAYKEIKKKDKEIVALKNLEKAIKTNNSTEIKKILGSMSNSDIAALDAKDILTKPQVIPHLSSGVFSSVEKGDKSQKDKNDIANAREKALGDAINNLRANPTSNSDRETIKNIMKNMNGSDLSEMIAKTPQRGVINPELIEHIKPSHLKDMEHLDDRLRRQIGTAIRNWRNTYGNGTRNHPAFDHVDKNPNLWT